MRFLSTSDIWVVSKHLILQITKIAKVSFQRLPPYRVRFNSLPIFPVSCQLHSKHFFLKNQYYHFRTLSLLWEHFERDFFINLSSIPFWVLPFHFAPYFSHLSSNSLSRNIFQSGRVFNSTLIESKRSNKVEVLLKGIVLLGVVI